jgi:1,4-dihydroxy-2-naphthoate octaprenyltransferase
MNRFKTWIGAMRLRTLPLSLSGIIVGSALAGSLGQWDSWIFLVAMSTTVLFQILSNLANDLGDSQKGTDNEHRVGPARAVQSGEISMLAMKKGVVFFVFLSFISAAGLIYLSLPNLTNNLLIFYGLLAILCVLAAMLYTLGKSAYGYSGFGDIMVFLFFGFVSVLGVFSLYGLSFEWLTILPAITIGSWSAAVLNLNNLRDVSNDTTSGKRTLVVQMGYQRAKYYHVTLLFLGLVAWLIFVFAVGAVTFSFLPMISLLPTFLIPIHLKRVFSASEPKALDSELKKVALMTFFSAILFAISLLIIH